MKFKSFVFLAISFLITNYSNAQAPSFFHSIKKGSPSKRVEVANEVFIKNIQSLDSLSAFKELESLKKWSIENGDPSMTVSALLFMAQYEENLKQPRCNDKKVLSLFNEANKVANANSLAYESAKSIFAKGVFYFHRYKFGPAFENCNNAIDQFRKIGLNKIPGSFMFLTDLGLIYYDFNEFDKALHLFIEATSYKPANTWQEKMNLTAIGLIYQKNGNFDSAYYFHEKARNVAIKENDSTWIGITSGNIGAILMSKGKLKKAIPFLNMDVKYSAKAKEWTSSAGALIKLAKISIVNNNIEEALNQLYSADTMLKKTNSFTLNSQLYEEYAIAYEIVNNTKKALYFRKQFELTKDSLNKKYNEKLYRDINVKIEAERHLSALRQIEDAKQKAFLKRNLIILILIIILISTLVVLKKIKQQSQNDKIISNQAKKILEIETNATKEKLLSANQKLEAYKENIHLKTKLIDDFQTEISALQQQITGPNNGDKIILLQELLQSTILTEDDWVSFKNLFENVHKGFFIRLRERLPNVTMAETRLITLTRIDLSDREMSAMLGISIDAVRKTRYRLRKKISQVDEILFEELVASI